MSVAFQVALAQKASPWPFSLLNKIARLREEREDGDG
jgi:hypothetical protein